MNKRLIQLFGALLLAHVSCAQFENSYFSPDTKYAGYMKFKGNLLSAINLDGSLLDNKSYTASSDLGSEVYGLSVDPKSQPYTNRLYQVESLRTLSPGFELGFSFIPDVQSSSNIGLGVYYFSEGGIPIVISYPHTGQYANATVFYKVSGYGYNILRRFDQWLVSMGAVVGSSREYAPSEVYPLIDVVNFSQMPTFFDTLTGHSTSTAIPVYGSSISVEHNTFELKDCMVSLGAYFKYFMTANHELYLPLYGSAYVDSNNPSKLHSAPITQLPAAAPISNIEFSRFFVFGLSVNISRFL